eukprot:1158648-Pelagomonas_calceolata.AAC.8
MSCPSFTTQARPKAEVRVFMQVLGFDAVADFEMQQHGFNALALQSMATQPVQAPEMASLSHVAKIQEERQKMQSLEKKSSSDAADNWPAAFEGLMSVP